MPVQSRCMPMNGKLVVAIIAVPLVLVLACFVYFVFQVATADLSEG